MLDCDKGEYCCCLNNFRYCCFDLQVFALMFLINLTEWGTSAPPPRWYIWLHGTETNTYAIDNINHFPLHP